MQKMLAAWKSDKLGGSLLACWLLTVFFSFWSNTLISFNVPLVGEMFPFRIFLPVTAVLYLIWMLRGNDRIWKDSSLLEKCVYGFIVILLLYGASSLLRAIDFTWTFRRLFNLCIDLCFFFLMLRLCRNKVWRRYTLYAVCAAVAILCVLGIWEVFHGGIFRTYYDDYKRFRWFFSIYQYPVVSYGNTNDFSSALLMCFSVILISLSRSWKSCGKAVRGAVVLAFGAIFLLILAGSARLTLLSFYILLCGFALFLLISDRKRLWIIVAVLCLIGFCRFSNQYRYVVPQIKTYIAEMKEYKEQQKAQSTEVPENPSAPENPSVPENPSIPESPSIQENPSIPESPSIQENPTTPGKPTLHLGDPKKQTLEEELFETDEETGEKELRDTGSAGVRAHLLLHAWDCFVESHGLGVGLGNTETLAAQRNIVPRWAGHSQYSIHCFIARLVADCGIFALLPLCAIAFLLLKAVLTALFTAMKRKDYSTAAYVLLFFAVLLTYPIVSTASSDAQDIVAMWVYLAVVVLLGNEFAAPHQPPKAPIQTEPSKEFKDA